MKELFRENDCEVSKTALMTKFPANGSVDCGSSSEMSRRTYLVIFRENVGKIGSV